MKKKLHMISSMIFIAMLCIALCFAFAGCNNAPEQLQNELGALLEGGGFEKGSSLVTAPIETTGEKGQKIVSLLEEQDYDKDGEVSIFDIFVSKDGSEVQPNGKVKVTLPAPFESESGYVTFHVRDDNSVETLETTYSEGKISFETDSFSYFVVANKSTEVQKYTFTATIEGEGGGTIYRMNFPCSDRYQTTVTEGTEITLEVEAHGGFAFTGWYLVSERGDSFVSADAEYTFTVNSDMTVYARVARTFSFDVMVFAGGGRLEVGGRDVGQNFMGDYVSGYTVTVKAIGDENYEFEGWYTNEATPALISSDAEHTFTVEGNTQVFAYFQEKVTSLSLDATGAGFSDGQATYSIGDANRPVPENVLVSGVTLSDRIALEKDTDYTIDLGGLDFTRKGTYTVTYTYKKDPQIKATLTVIVEGAKYSLTVGQQGAGGCVSINGDTASSLESNPYYENHEVGVRITLVAATRSSEYTFKGWFEIDETILTHLVLKDTPVSTELTYAFDMPENGYTVYAVFEEVEQEKTYPFNAYVSGGSGVIYYNSEEQPNGYQAEWTAGTKITLTAVANAGSLFKGWYEPDGTEATTLVLKETPVSTSATYEFTVPAADYTVYAVFEEVITYTFSASIEDDGGYFEENGENAGRDCYIENLDTGDTVTVKVVANAGYHFIGWYTNSDVPERISTSAEYTFTVENEDISVMAVFEADVTALLLDGANAGFSEGKATYTIGDETKPNPEYVVVSGVTANGNVYLTKDVDYTIDLGGLDFAKAGTYTITYTYIKNTSIKGTLQVVVNAPKYLFSAVVGTTGGLISRNDETLPNGYAGEHAEGDTVTLKAVANEGYKFKGWYTDTDVPQLISDSAEYTFTIENEDRYVTALFEANVTALLLDGANAGFTEGVATYTIGDETKPNPEYVVVSGVTVEENVPLTKDVDYTIDLGGLDFETAGTYTITYTYLKNSSVTATLQVVVHDAESVDLSYDGSAFESEYNGGCAAYVFKSAILNNGTICDLEALGLSYEWRDMSGNVVEIANDTTWDTEACFKAPSQVGTYQFVIYDYADGVKTDLLTLERTITTRTVSLLTELSVSEYEYYTPIAKVEAENNSVKYYAMAMPGELGSSAATKIPAIEVVPDENGNFIIGNNNEFIFRPYDSGKCYQESDGTSTVLYNLRIGGGPYQAGSLYMGSSGSISYDSGYSAGDFAVKMYLNSDGSATVHCTHEGGILRFAYSETDGYYFTAYNPSENVEDTGTYYPVYLYNTYVAPLTENYQYIGGSLDKTYDGTAVTVNPFKDFVILTADGEDWAALSKYGTGRFAWGTGKGENLQAMTEDGEGNLVGPTEVGEYCIVFQLQDKEGNWQTMGYGPLVYFSITAAA